MTYKHFDVIATVQKKSCAPSHLIDMQKRGATIFRINGSHTSVPDMAAMVKSIRKALPMRRIKILVDLPGSKVRIRNLHHALVVKQGKTFKLRKDNFNFPEFIQHLRRNQLLLANDGTLQFKLVHAANKMVTFMPLISGALSNGKGINIYGDHPKIPFLHKEDYRLIEAGIQHKIDYLGFSYIRSLQDAQEAMSIVSNTSTRAICKIETSEACDRLKQILPVTETILIDRGDLSSEIGIHRVPGAIERIIASAKKLKKKVFVATQFLHYMLQHPIPSISEISVLHDTIKKADGLQLSEETAIGQYPLRALEVVRDSLNFLNDQ